MKRWSTTEWVIITTFAVISLAALAVVTAMVVA